MKQEHKELAKNIIDRIKNSNGGLQSDTALSQIVKDNNLRTSILAELSDDYGLVKKAKGSNYRLTTKGSEFESFEKLEKDLKRTPFTLYQKIQLTITFISVVSALVLGVLNYFQAVEKSDLKDDNVQLESENVQLKSDLEIYKDLINEYKDKEQLKTPTIENDTISYKN